MITQGSVKSDNLLVDCVDGGNDVVGSDDLLSSSSSFVLLSLLFCVFNNFLAFVNVSTICEMTKSKSMATFIITSRERKRMQIKCNVGGQNYNNPSVHYCEHNMLK